MKLKFNFSSLKNIFSRKHKNTGLWNPYRDWFIIVLFFVSLSLIILVVCAVFYFQVDRGVIFRGGTTVEYKPVTVDRTALKDISNFYILQETKLEALKKSKPTATTTPGAVDPSL